MRQAAQPRHGEMEGIIFLLPFNFVAFAAAILGFLMTIYSHIGSWE